LVRDPCYVAAGKDLRIERGESAVLTQTLEPRVRIVDVSAADMDGNAVPAAVFADGVEIARPASALNRR